MTARILVAEPEPEPEPDGHDRGAGADDIAVIAGGTIPQEDVPELLEAGAAEVFPASTPLDVLVTEVRTLTATPSR